METVVKTGMENLTSAISTLTTMAGDLLNVALANPVLALCFAGGVIGIVAGVIHTVKKL